MMEKRLIWLISLLGCFAFVNAQRILVPSDAGSKVHFVIKNFGIRTGGDFSGLKGTIKFDPNNPGASTFDVTVNSSTIDTDNNTRDGHLKKEEYFDVKKYPTIHMICKRVQATVKPGRYQFTGDLTIKDVTKSIVFQFNVVAKGGGYLFTSDDIPLNRRDFNVGGSSISMADDLKVSLSVFAK